jgi:hypothetical protein
MVGRYFRCRREFAEMIMLAGTGGGAALVAYIIDELMKYAFKSFFISLIKYEITLSWKPIDFYVFKIDYKVRKMK